jgi:hypothetical protein
MGEHVDLRQLREQQAKRVKPKVKSKKHQHDFYDDGTSKKPKTFKQFINTKNGTYEPEDGVDDDDEAFRGIKIK